MSNDSHAFVVYGSLYFLNDSISDYLLINKSIKTPEFPPSEIQVMQKFLKDVWDDLNAVIKTVQISAFIDKWDNITHIEHEVEILHTPSSFNITIEG